MAKMDETKRFNVEDIVVEEDIKKKKVKKEDDKGKEEIASEKIEYAFQSLDVKKDTDLKSDLNLADKEELEQIVHNDFQGKTIVDVKIPESKTIGIASDHRGYNLKQKLTKYLNKKGYTVVDYGSDSRISSDYPEFGFKLGKAVANFEVEKGIAICGSGIGISIACNKIKGVRCAKVDNVKEIKYARKDNDANIMAIAGNMPLIRAKDIVDAYLKTPFSGLERHQRRIDMLNERA